jgi:hypothetical protein
MSFRQFWDLGYRRLLPIAPPSSGIRNAGKRPGILNGSGTWHGLEDWQNLEATEADLDRWEKMGAGVGLKLGGEPHLLALDVDVLAPALAELGKGAAFKMLGPAPIRIGHWPKMMLLYRSAVPIGYRYLRFDDGVSVKGALIECLTEGKQSVIEGIHPNTRKPYRLVDGLWPIDQLTEITAEQLDAFFEHLRGVLPGVQIARVSTADRAKIDQSRLKGDMEQIASAVRAIPGDAFDVYREWITLAAALRSSCAEDPEVGLDIFEEYSSRYAGEQKETPYQAYMGLKPPFAVGAQWIYDKAASFGWTGRAAEFFEPPSDSEIFPKPLKEQKRFDLVPLNCVAASALEETTKPLIKGLLDQGALSILYGESNTGKTFAALSMAYHIAAGRPWGGMTVSQAACVYVAAEGGRGVRKRAAALAQKLGDGVPLYFLMSPVDLLHADADVAPLIESIRELPETVGFGVLDTLSRAMAGGDENTSTDMGAMVKNLDRIRAATGVHLMAVHHSGKDRAKGARGHSLLRAAIDTEIECADGQITVVKQRDMEMGFSSAFRLEPVHIGLDGEGMPVTSCVLRLVGTAEEREPVKPTEREQELLTVIAGLDEGQGVRSGDIVAYYKAQGKPLKNGTARQLVARLAQKTLLSQVDRGLWRVTERDKTLPKTLQNIFD